MLKIEKFENRKWYNSKGKLHREDGPAMEYTGGHKEWYLDGVEYTEKEYTDLVFDNTYKE